MKFHLQICLLTTALSTVATDITEVQSDCYPDSWNDSVCMECNDFEEIDDDQCSCKSSDYYEESETAAYDLRSNIDTMYIFRK